MRRPSLRNPSPSALAIGLVLATVLPASCGAETRGKTPVPDPPPQVALAGKPAAHAGFTVPLPGEALTLEMVPIPGADVDGKRVDDFWISRSEISWDAFDVFLYGAGTGTDAVTRPSVPYISMDRGFGHEGWPVLSLSAKGGQAFCDWLSAMTGRTFRLPTESEWLRACGAAPEDLDAHAWSAENAGGKSQRMGQKLPNEFGLHDMLGNVAEWCVAKGGRRLVAGGSYRTPAAELGPDTRQPVSPAWNASDPQIPKSVWWLADAGFVGLRVVCDSSPPPSTPLSR